MVLNFLVLEARKKQNKFDFIQGITAFPCYLATRHIGTMGMGDKKSQNQHDWNISRPYVRTSGGSYDSLHAPTRSRVRTSRNRFRPVDSAGALGRSRNQIRPAGATSSGRHEWWVGARKHKRLRPVSAAISSRFETRCIQFPTRTRCTNGSQPVILVD